MVKNLHLLVFMANVFCLTLSSDQISSSSAVASASSSSTTSYASASSYASSYSSGFDKEDNPPNDDDCNCGPNEQQVPCPEAVCVPKTCDEVGFPIACYDLPPDGKCPSPPGCICIENYVRNKGQCIPMKECPSCGGDPNAQSGCGVNCNNRCEKANNTCIDICYFNACDCKKGYLFDETCNKCVKPSECSNRKCKKNEVYDLCPAPCPLRTCGINDAAVDCVPALEVGNPKCKPPKCRCKDGYYRNDCGECVRWEDCPKCLKSNEEYDPCIAPCPPKVCGVDERLILCLPSPVIGDPSCVAGCRCSEGFYKNDQNVCVPKDQCPVCKKPNEIYDPCIAPCPPRRCDVDDRVIKCAAPPQVGSPDCKAGCRCADGYYRNAKGICVTRDECPLPCKSDEVYEKCPPFLCKPLTCSDIGFNITCPTQEYGCPGNAACICADDKVRDDNGNCIPRNQCPSCRGDPHAVAGCGIYCNKRCSDIGKKPGACIALCKENACDCRDGYYLDEPTQKCVLPKQCTIKCGPNEQYNECINGGCQAKNCSQVGFPIPCPKLDPKDCRKGCLCIDGYLRNKKGVCVPRNECTSCGGDKNAQPGCGINCNKQCSDLGKTEPDSCIALCKENACDCKKGYYYDSKKKRCVKPEDCTQKCGINEEYNKCTQANCNPQNCTQLGYPIACPSIDPSYCKGGCLCKPGHVRNHKRICIPSKECPSCGGDKNAQSGCGGQCRKRCSDFGKDPRICTLICEFNGCDCKDGYVIEDKTGKCVKPENCSNCGGDNNAVPGCGINCNQQCSDIGKEPGACIALCIENACDCRKGYYKDPIKKRCVKPEDCTPTCPVNEEYNECTNANCAPQNCTQVGFPIPCPRIDPKYCKKGCQCKSGYARNKKGKCIPIKGCPTCGGDENAQSGCGGYCNRRCSDIGKKPGPCKKICEINACDCKEGYYRDENTKKCVKPENCTKTCGINEEYNECTNANCAAKTCDELGFPIPCPRIDPKYCKKGCQCKPRYVRNKKGICTSDKECPSCGGDPNAQSGCGGYCDKRCSDAGSNETRPCILICQLNGCDCKDGYYRDDNNDNKCVKLEDCSRPKCLPENNEVYSDCINGGCTRRNCSQYGQPVPCVKIDPKYCKKGCVCKEKYLRNSNGKCIPENDCPEACNGPNEQYVNCTYDCPRQTCESLDRAYACPIKTGQNCKPMCKCKPGYFRNKLGQCITEKQCRMCKGPHEYYSCGGACDNECATLNEKCPIVNIKCNEKCYCEENYARALNRTCIPISCCGEPQCPINERYEKCPGASCQPLTCSQLGEPLLCPEEPNYKKCPFKPGCVCIDGYVRNDKEKCIPVLECPSCGCDPNAQSGCGVNCGKYCKDLLIDDKDGISCIEICYFNSCDCKDGYYYDTIQKKCMLPGQCTDICGKNEIFEDCSNPIFRAKNCTELGFPIDCDAKCKKGCICKEDYARNEKGICIPVRECPKCGGDPNAQSGCGVNCGKLCPNNNRNPNICPKICYPNACDCKDGFFFDNNTKTCVEKDECSPRCDDLKNEVYDSCINGGCGIKNCSQIGRPEICVRPRKCIKGCSCKESFLRLDNGTCVPKDQCPSTGCGGDPNAEPGCGFNCGKRCPRETSKKFCPRIACKPDKCDCKKGYLYDVNIKECVKQEDCTPVCDTFNHEVYDPCVNGGCNKRNCSQLAQPLICIDPIKCKPGCSCKEGYLRLNNGTCVPINKCPRPKCKKNERYEKCPPRLCEPQTCSASGYPMDCPDFEDDQCGYPACVCDYGYVRNSNGICIPIDDCPGCGGDPNAEPGCGLNCNKQCPKKTNGICPRIVCKRNGCECKDGFLYDRNLKRCVRQKDCTPICDACNNEVYDPCINGGCSKRNCSQLGLPDICIDPIKCKKGCSCKKGYLRLKNGKCVPVNQCPKPRCKKNERYEECPGRVCEPQTCSEVGYPIDCDCDDEECGLPTCICEEGYARDDDGYCVPIEYCPACGGDPNATPGCGYHCPNRCPKAINPEFCPRIECQPKSCDCKDGFLYDVNTKTCVDPEECSPICDKSNNEVYDPCVNGPCGWKNCSQVGGPQYCIDVSKCIKGCSCKKNYYRLDNGTCVPENQCPPNCRGANEVYDPCIPYCSPQTCRSIGQKLYCPKIPANSTCSGSGCRCKSNYFRNSKNECIKKEDCLKCTGPNEYFSCGPYCDNVCSELDKETKDNCIVKTFVCVERCYCDDGYARNDKGICIPISQCPECPPPSTTTRKPKTTTTVKPSPNVNITASIADYEKGNQILTAKFLYQMLQNSDGKSFVFSTLSLLNALAQLTLNAEETNRKQLLNLFKINKDQIEAIFPILIQGYKEQRNVIFNVNNKIYENKNHPLSEAYIQQSKKIFDAEAENIDFGQPVPAAQTINKWISDDTNGLITNLIDSSALSEDTRLVVLNCIYFLGDWMKQFNEDNTTDRDFYVSDTKAVSTKTMFQKGRFKYGDFKDLNCKLLELPYKNKNFSLVILLPNKRNGLMDVAKLIAEDSSLLPKAIASMTTELLNIYLPKLNIRSKMDLKPILQEAGVTDIFKPVANNFKGVLKTEELLYVTDIIQEAVIKVDEKGTEATAVTAINVRALSAIQSQNTYTFDADHPFGFILYYGENTVTFAGGYLGMD